MRLFKDGITAIEINLKLRYIDGYDDNYIIADNGSIWNLHKVRQKKPTMTPSGLVVGLSKNGVQTRKYVHRLVYEAYKGDIKGMIHFKDGNKSNCHIDNLVDLVGQYNFNKKKR